MKSQLLHITTAGGLSEIVEDDVTGLKVPIVIKDNERCIDVSELANKSSYSPPIFRFIKEWSFSMFYSIKDELIPALSARE